MVVPPSAMAPPPALPRRWRWTLGAAPSSEAGCNKICKPAQHGRAPHTSPHSPTPTPTPTPVPTNGRPDRGQGRPDRHRPATHVSVYGVSPACPKATRSTQICDMRGPHFFSCATPLQTNSAFCPRFHILTPQPPPPSSFSAYLEIFFPGALLPTLSLFLN